MTNFEKVFGENKIIIGMVHLMALPGAPNYAGDLDAVYEAAYTDLKALEDGGVNAVIVENFNDTPYGSSNELITYTAMTAIATKLRSKCKLPMGINVHYNCTEAEWAIAYACNYDFIRVEVFAENRGGPNGIYTASGPSLMRIKARYPKDIVILADVNVKHTFPIVEQPLDFTIDSLIEGGVDAIISSGISTGHSPEIGEVKQIKKLAGKMPVIIGSGVKNNNVNDYLKIIDGVIVGSSLKKDGIVTNQIDKNRVTEFMSVVRSKQ